MSARKTPDSRKQAKAVIEATNAPPWKRNEQRDLKRLVAVNELEREIALLAVQGGLTDAEFDAAMAKLWAVVRAI